MSYSRKILDLAKNTVNQLTENSNKMRELEARKANYASEYYKSLVEELKRERDEILWNGNHAAADLHEAQKIKVREEFTLNPEQIADDAKLLQYGFNFTVEDVDKLLDKYKGNRTMERLITDYAQGRNIKPNRSIETESSKLAQAEKMHTYYKSVVARPEYADTWFDDAYFSKISEGVD